MAANSTTNSSNLISHPLERNIDDDLDDDVINRQTATTAPVTATMSSSSTTDTNSKTNDKPEVPPRLKLSKNTKSIDNDTNNNCFNSKTNVVASNDNKQTSSLETIQNNRQQFNDNSFKLQPNQVRWLYKEDGSNSKWTVFNGVDSLRIETEYLSSVNNKSECKLVQVLGNLFEVNIFERKCSPIYWEGSSMSVMRGTWFYDQSWEPLDEDLSERIELEHVLKFNRKANGSVDNFIVSSMPRVTSLKEMSTLNNTNNTDTSNSAANGSTEQSNNDTNASNKNEKAAKTQNDPIYTIQIKDQTCYWYAEDDVYLGKNKTFMKNFSFTFGKQKFGTKIVRGYKVLADTEDKINDINHLVFVIHGIAQKLYEKSVIKNCEDLRKGCDQMKAKFLPNANKDGRCEFIPVDWRSSLTLDAGIVESITPQTLKFVRNKLNASALDIMYYTSPLFRFEIMNGLCAELNRLYALFCEKNPYFKAKKCKVSVVAHSLGTVIFYDILTSNNSILQLTNRYGEDLGQETQWFNHFSNNDTNMFQDYLNSKKRIDEIEQMLLKSNQNLNKLTFTPENFFCLGSPLAVFLALRGVRPSGTGVQDHILPKNICKNLFNLFHPCDAIAYRLEPLILKHYSTIMPVEIHRSSDSSNAKHTPYKEMKNKVIPKADVELSVTGKEPSTSTSSMTMSLSFLKSKLTNDGAEASDLSELSQATSVQTSKKDLADQIEQVDLEKRFDYQLPTSNFELIYALTSHTAYWNSLDVALFIVTQLYADE